MKIQIIDPSEVFCQAVKERLPDTFQVDFYTDGAGASARICNFRPDILVLSSDLPGGDGLHILHLVQSTGLRPMVLLVARLATDYLVEQATAMKVSHIMCKPCDISAVAECIMHFGRRLTGEKDSWQSHIRNFLMELNFRSHLCGDRYIMTAFSLLVENPDQHLSKELYPAVAKVYKGTWQQIERGIRLYISNAWENREGDAWNLYFPNRNKKPSNSVFLARAMAYLQTFEEKDET